MTNATFEKLRDSVFRELLKANTHFDVFWDLRVPPAEFADIRDAYRTFFLYTLAAHNDRFCISINNLTNYSHTTCNFYRMLNYVRRHKNLFKNISAEQIDDMVAKIESHKHLTDKIEFVRNKYIAHNELSEDSLAKIKTTYTYEEGRHLLEDLKNILNTVSSKYDGRIYSFHILPRLNIEDMLRDLTESRLEKIKRLNTYIEEPTHHMGTVHQKIVDTILEFILSRKKVIQIVLSVIGAALTLSGAVTAVNALIVFGAVLVGIPFLLGIMNDLLNQRFGLAFRFVLASIRIAFLVLLAFITIWILGLDWHEVAKTLDRPVTVLIIGAAIFQVFWLCRGPTDL